jgi:predicted nucleic acid-binding protein
MTMVDTSVWIDYFNGNDNRFVQKLDVLLQTDLVVTGDIILAEILQGFTSDVDFKKAKEALDTIECFSLIGKEIALLSANNFRKLRKKGITVRKTTDMIIRTFCIHHSIPLLHNDRDFNPMKSHLGLITIN